MLKFHNIKKILLLAVTVLFAIISVALFVTSSSSTGFASVAWYITSGIFCALFAIGSYNDYRRELVK